MKLVSSREILRTAQDENYAVGAFNIHNLETLQAVISGASQLKSPVIIQTTAGTIEWAGMEYIIAMVRTAARLNNIPIVLHFDHARDLDLIKKAVKLGYTSIMIDGSYLPYEENIKITRKVVDLAHQHEISVEAELGKIGGQEDDIIEEKDRLTDPDMVVDFVKKTGIDSLAIAIGTAHGLYKGEPVLNFELLKMIRAKVGTPLVLHGASGISGKNIKKAVKYGINKVNFATELKIAFTDKTKDFLIKSNESDPRKYLNPGKRSVQELVQEKIEILGSAGKA